MLSGSQIQRLSTKLVNALSKALDRFPALLDASDPEAAAETIAGIIKTQLQRPIPPPDPAAALDHLLRQFSNEP